MAQYKIGITIEATTADEAQQLAQLLQQATSNIDNKDMIKLLSSAVKNPKIIKNALKFL